MSIFEDLGDTLGKVIKSAKDVPVETVCAVGLTFIAMGSFAVKAIAEGGSDVIGTVGEKITSILD